MAGADPGTQWWTRFESPALDQLVERALAANQTLAAAAATLDAGAGTGGGARAGASLPQLELDAGIGRQKYGAQFLGPLAQAAAVHVFLGRPDRAATRFDFTGGISRGVEQQRALADYQRQQLAGAQLAVSGNAVMQALQIAALRAQIATVEATAGARSREPEAGAAGASTRARCRDSMSSARRASSRATRRSCRRCAKRWAWRGTRWP